MRRLNDEEKKSPTLGLSQQSNIPRRAELEYYGASLVITATAPKQGERLDPALRALYEWTVPLGL